MPEAVEVKRLEECSSCGRSADYNSPVALPNGKVICDRCANVHAFHQREPEFLYAIEQYRRNGRTVQIEQYNVIRHRMLIAHTTNDKAHLRNVWWREDLTSGTKALPLMEEEKKGRPEIILKKLAVMVESGTVRCTSCREDLQKENIAGFPLFAGVTCHGCWKKHLERVEEQRKTGNVCRICGQPRLLCCC